MENFADFLRVQALDRLGAVVAERCTIVCGADQGALRNGQRLVEAGVMFLRHKICRKDGKEHRYWSIVENRRVSGGRTVQRHVLYLGEINDSQRAAWCRRRSRRSTRAVRTGKQIALFPEDRAAPVLDCDVVHVRLSGLRLRRPRQWGGCWLAVPFMGSASTG